MKKYFRNLQRKGAEMAFISCTLAACAAESSPAVRVEAAERLIRRGSAYLANISLEEAEASFRTAAETAPLPGAYDGLACVKFMSGDTQGAESLLRRTIAAYPGYLPARRNLATILDLTGRPGEAARHFRRVIADDPEDFTARNNYGMLLIERGKDRLGRSFLYDALVLSGSALVQRNIEGRNGP